jgi:hypothetical protein
MADYQLSPCQVSYKGSDLGKTQGGLTVSMNQNSVTLHTDQDGEVPVDEQLTGTTVTVSGNLADITLANIAIIMNETRVTDGDDEKVQINTNVGTSLLDNGGELIIKPYVNGSVTTDENKWITLHNAGIKATAEMAYDMSNQRVISFEATAYADSNGKVATFGKTSVT